MSTSPTDPDDSADMNTTGLTGTYTVIPLPERHIIDPGEEVEIDAYIIGAGAIGDNQLDVIHEHPELITDDYGSIKVRIATKPNGEIVTGDEAEEQYRTEFSLNDTGGKFSFAPRYFREASRPPTGDESAQERPLAFPISYLDDRHDGAAPIHYELTTADNAPPGDYRLTLLFTYASEGRIYQDRRDVSIHVRTRREQWQPIPTIAAVTSAIVALLSLLVTAAGALLTAGVL